MKRKREVLCVMTALQIFWAFCLENIVVTIIAIASIIGFVAVGITLIILNVLNKNKKKKEA